MVDVKGGFAFIDMSVYGAFTSGTAKTSQDVTTGGVFAKTQQTQKPVMVCGLTIASVGTYAPFLAVFTSATASSVTTATAIVPIGGKNHTIAITSAGSITVTKAS